MNLSIHLALMLNVNSHIFIVIVMSLSSILFSYFKMKSKSQKESLIQDQNIRRTLLTKQKICNCQQSCLLFLIQEVFLTLYTIHRSSIQHWLKRGRKPPISSSNRFIDMSVLY